ncbi:MAG: hypothetical protein V1872_06275 [bacterium]
MHIEKKILVIRLMGLGDVACIGLPGLRLLRLTYPHAKFSFLTYASAGEIIQLEQGLEDILVLSPKDWPDNFEEAVNSFTKIGTGIIKRRYDLVYNLDTWFMPCFLTRFLKDNGIMVKGNYLNKSIKELLEQAGNGKLTNDFFFFSRAYIESTFPAIDAWHSGPWWKREDTPSYPEYYLNHCCNIPGRIDMGIDLAEDEELKKESEGKPIIALATQARAANRQYPFSEGLKSLLLKEGYYVWGDFDASLPLQNTLKKLKASNLLITVPSAPQWLARMVGCKVLLIPGPTSPGYLGERYHIPKIVQCQYCMYHECLEKIDNACMKVDPKDVMKIVKKIVN